MRQSTLCRLPLCVLLLACCACGGGTPAAQAGPRRSMLQALGTTVIIPAYESLADQAAALADAAALLQGAPTADTLAAAQSAWRRTRAAWKQTEAFAIGPAATLRTAAKIDWSPIRPERIEAQIAGSDPIDAGAVEDYGTNLKGFLALEYLLFDPVNGDDGVLAALSAAGAERRRQYLRAVAENLRDQTDALRDAWLPDGGNYAAVLATAGPGNAAYPTVKSAVDAVVNQLIFLAEDIADTQLLAPLGTRDGDTPRPDLIAAHRSQNGLADVLDALAGIQNVYFASYAGRHGAGFDAIVAGLDAHTNNVLALAIEHAIDTAARIAVPLEEAVSTEPETVEHAQQRAKELMQRFEVDLVSVLGTTLRFNPSDGD